MFIVTANTMIDTQKYEHLRFTDDFNCSSFVKLVCADNGIKCPIDFVSHTDSKAIAQAILDKKPMFEEVEKPQDFDVIYMREKDGRRHVGLYFKYGNIYHLRREGSPVFQKITTEIKSQIIGIYRLKED